MDGLRFSIGALALVVTTGCGAVDSGSYDGRPSAAPLTGPYRAEVVWAANRETAVNGPGGGYRVYYSRTPGFDVASAQFEDVPYVSGAQAPTSVVVDDLPSGTIYFKVVAYSPLNRPGASGGSTSQPSAQAQVTLP